MSFSVRGRVTTIGGGEQIGPDGASTRSERYPMATMGVGGLIGRIGNGPVFPIGANRNPITMPADGRLMLGVNDDVYGDNAGAFLVTVTRR